MDVSGQIRADTDTVVPAWTKRLQIAAGTPRRHPFSYEYSRIYPGTRQGDTQHDPHRHRRRN